METSISTKTGRFTVHTTRDYSVFKSPEFQRGLEKKTIKEVKQSVLQYGGLLQPVVVDVSGNVIDGQHRVEARIFSMSVSFVMRFPLFTRSPTANARLHIKHSQE